MPNWSPLRSYRNRLDELLEERLSRTRSARTRRYLRFLFRLRLQLAEKRYWSRPATYQEINYATKIDSIINARPADFRFFFRMSKSEFDRLIDDYGQDQVFERTGRRPPPHPKYPLALTIYRLAHGHELKAIAWMFGVSGTASRWTDLALQAIVRPLAGDIVWPEGREKQQLKRRILERYGIPHCLGFIDGTHINLERAPARGPIAGAWHSRHERYGWNVLAVVDDSKRFTFMHWGFSASAADSRIQAATALEQHPDRFFDGREVIIGDSGFTNTPRLIAMFKRLPNQPKMRGGEAYFNHRVKRARVIVEHAFGVLKARWASLRNLRARVGSERDEARGLMMIQAAFILHNRLINSWQDAVGLDEVQKVLIREAARRRAGFDPRDRPRYDPGEDWIRRDMLWREMKAYEEAEGGVPIDVNDFEW